MTKLEFLAFNLPYGILFQRFEGSLKLLSIDSSMGKKPERRSIQTFTQDEGYKPICRPLSDLTKKIVQADYNDGKPFIPIEQIKKDIGCGMHDLYFDWIRSFLGAGESKYRISVNQAPFEIFQLFLKWHFAIGLEENEFIPVTETFNPYI